MFQKLPRKFRKTFVQCKCSLKRQRIKWVALWDQATQVVHLIKHIYRHVYLSGTKCWRKVTKAQSSVVSHLHPSLKYICDFRYHIGVYAISFTVDRVLSSCLFSMNHVCSHCIIFAVCLRSCLHWASALDLASVVCAQAQADAQCEKALTHRVLVK